MIERLIFGALLACLLAGCAILFAIDAVLLKLEKVMQNLDALTAQVAANTSLERSAIQLIVGLAAKIEEAGTDPVALAALTAELKGSAEALADAIAANTPAATSVPPAPAESPSDPQP